MQLGVGSALVRPEHDGVGRLVRELPQVQVLGMAQQLDVTAPALLAVLEVELVLDDEGLVGELEGLAQLGRDGRVLGLGL